MEFVNLPRSYISFKNIATSCKILLRILSKSYKVLEDLAKTLANTSCQEIFQVVEDLGKILSNILQDVERRSCEITYEITKKINKVH